jgi:hypothetical protein
VTLLDEPQQALWRAIGERAVSALFASDLPEAQEP